jgi:hypothetical protein
MSSPMMFAGPVVVNLLGRFDGADSKPVLEQARADPRDDRLQNGRTEPALEPFSLSARRLGDPGCHP